MVNKLWRDGPLRCGVIEEQLDANVPPECLEELRASEKRVVHGLLASEDGQSAENLVKVQNFSSLSRLIGVLTCVLKFCSILRKKTGSTAFDGNERKSAEFLLIKEAQVSLKAHKNFPTWEKQLSLFADDNGILRCRGRIDHASTLPYATKHPVILPGDHHLTTLYIRQAHARVLHNGVQKNSRRVEISILGDQGEKCSETNSLQLLCLPKT